MLFTAEATQQFTDASLQIYTLAQLIGLEPYPRAPIFVRHFDITLRLDSGFVLDTGKSVKCISDSCVRWSGNIFLFLRDALDDEEMMKHLIENNPEINDFKHSVEYEKMTHFTVNIESSPNCRLTVLTLKFLILNNSRAASAA